MPSRERIELSEDLRFQRWEWRLQRLGWGALALLLAAGALGLLGPPGPLAQAAQEAGPLRVDYHRVQRRIDPTTLRVAVAPGPAEKVELLLGRTFAGAVDVRSIFPEPKEQRSTSAGQVLVFSREPGQSLEVVLHVELDTVGWVASEVAIAGQEPVAVSMVGD